MKTAEERLKSYEPLWENWTYTGEFLGEGAMSSVFEIQSTAMGMHEVAALKIITVKKNPHGEIVIPENALNEIKILRTLSGSSNIVNYHDSTQRNIYDDDGNLSGIDILIKMEKLSPLSEGLHLNESEVERLAKDMCTAILHASEHGVIHRDIKPQNIFVDSDGNYKLGDFGISKIVSAMTEHYTLNIGTLAYTAPEVASGVDGKYDVSADIYSLGLVLYTFLNNGYLPFAKSMPSLHDAISKRLSGAPFPSPANGSKALKSIVMRACAADRVKRFKTPAEMLEALELLASGGKKLVADPFATIDANIDVTDEMSGGSIKSTMSSGTLSDKTDTPSSREVKSASGSLRINMDKSSEGSKSEAVASSGVSKRTGTLTIRMDSSSPGKEKEAEAPPKTDSGLKSGTLRINMSKSSPASEAPKSVTPCADTASVTAEAPKPEAKPETKPKSGSSFFSTPKSL